MAKGFKVNDKVKFKIGRGYGAATVKAVLADGRYTLTTDKGNEITRSVESLHAA